LPEVWNNVRRAVDDIGKQVSSSSQARLRRRRTTLATAGAGRMSRLAMRPMSLLEAGRSSGSVSLRALFDGTPARAQRPGSAIRELIDWLCIGGWPAHADYR
jgi:uncharacterized protein